jgi:hypothetical protein
MGKRDDGKAITPYEGSWAEYMEKLKNAPPNKPLVRFSHIVSGIIYPLPK